MNGGAASSTPLLLLLGWACALVAADEPIEIRPLEDPTVLLSNPDMGWVLYENAVLDPGASTIATAPDERFPGVDQVAVMFSWADIERRPGDYDFSRVDQVAGFWRARGKGIHLRLSSESLLWWNDRRPPAGTGVPDHVLAELPAEAKQVRLQEGRSYTVVDARIPSYRAALSRFLRAVAAHFRGERAVGLVDLRGFGLWGEWHSGFRYPDADQRHAALAGIIDCYADAFPDQHVALSYSHDPDGPRELYAGPTDRYDAASTASYDDFLRYSAFDHALAKANVTWRRDGVGGAVYSNQRRLCEEAFTRGRGPFMSEFASGYAQARKGDTRWLRWLVEDALSLHPNYVCLLGWQHHEALAFLREQPELVAHGLRTMGYRLVPLAIRHPARVRSGTPFAIGSDWLNRGVGRCLQDLRLVWILASADGAVTARLDGGATGAQAWVAGTPATIDSRLTSRGVVPGPHRLRVALHAPDGRAIALPLPGRAEDGSYALDAVIDILP